MPAKFRIGIIGCGNISGAYLTNARHFDILEIAALADLDIDRARAKAAEHQVPAAVTVGQLLDDKSIQLVVNLTIPAAHEEVSMKIIEAGKHLYSEKPLGINRDQARHILEAAKAHNVRVGCAPDTFLGSGQQTARRAIDDGLIGKPVAALAFMMCPGHESWHPAPEFYYMPGGGPMFDMGPYYITSLINLLGPVKRVSGSASIAISPRTITSQPLKGTKIEVQTPDHIAGTIDFASGAIATIVTSFAVHYHEMPPIQVFGTDATLRVPDPNNFDGEVLLHSRDRHTPWETVPARHPLGYGRSAGIADMAYAILADRDHRASGKLASTVVEVMQGLLESAESGAACAIKSSAPRPAAVPFDLPEGTYES